MNAQPAICPECGELIIASIVDPDGTLAVPDHRDRVMPSLQCRAGTRVMRDGKILQS